MSPAEYLNIQTTLSELATHCEKDDCFTCRHRVIWSEEAQAMLNIGVHGSLREVAIEHQKRVIRRMQEEHIPYLGILDLTYGIDE